MGHFLRKTKEDSEKTRQDIIDAGISIFSENWFDSIKMSDIAKKAGITRGAIYWHFKNKMVLFIEIHKLVSEEITAIISKSLAEGETVQEKLFSTFKNIILKFYNDKKLRTMCKVWDINQSVFDKKEFKEWNIKYHKEKRLFFSELFNKSIGINLGEINCEKKSFIELISIIAYLRGLLDILIYKEEVGIKMKKLNDEDISKLINIFFHGLFNHIPEAVSIK